MTYAVMDSPIGPLTLVSTEAGELTGLYMDKQRHLPAIETFDVPLHLAGTPFQQRVWTALKAIPYGEITTYGEIARELGLVPGASRAVGLANGKNPVSIIVPCHRVVGSTGDLTGYGGGLHRKQALLDHERGDALF
jgi:methylated-DNA-[protein]-cysteine S-methyltransferase